MSNEPVAVSAAIHTLILGVIALLIAFNAWHPSDAQIAAVLGVYTAVVVVLGSITRSKVTPTSNE